MTDKKLSQLFINTTPARNDVVYGIDVSEAADADKSKGFVYGQLKPFYDVRDYGASRTGTPAANKAAIQACIDAASLVGAVVLVTEPYPCSSGLILKRNVFLQGNSPQSFKSPYPYGGGFAVSGNVPVPTPSGGAFVITDKVGLTGLADAFLIVQSNTGVDSISFVYPNNDMNTTTPATSLIQYPPAIAAAQDKYLSNVRFTNLNFTGAWICIDLTINTVEARGCQDLYFDTIYGYPFSGRFIKLNNCYDVPRISRCHVNPSSGMNLYWDNNLANSPNKTAAINYVIENGEPSFQFVNMQQFGARECFIYAVKCGYYVEGGSPGTWGSFLDCNVDLAKQGFYFKNMSPRTQIAITNSMAWMSTGTPITERDFITIENSPDTYLKVCNAHAVTGTNPEVTSSSNSLSNSFLKVIGTAPHVSLLGCSIDGNWNKALDVPTSPKIKDFGNSWNGGATAQQSILNVNPLSLVVKGIELRDTALVASINGAAPAPTRTIKIKVGGVFYDILAIPSDTGIANAYGDLGWQHDYDPININVANDLSSGKVASLKDALNTETGVTQGSPTSQFTYVASALDTKPALRSENGNIFLVNTTTVLGSIFTVLVAVRPSVLANGTTDVPFMGNNALLSPLAYITNDKIGIYEGTNNSIIERSGTNLANTTYVVAFVVNGANSKVYYNGTTTAGTFTMPSQTGIAIGSFNQTAMAGRSLVGDYYKILIANTELTKAQINDTVALMKVDRPSLTWVDLA